MPRSLLEEQNGVLAGFMHEDGVEGYLALPAAGTTHPGIVLVQEWSGIEPALQRMAQRLAREGYVVLAPDLYHGKVATSSEEAAKLMQALDQLRAVQEIQAAIGYLMGRFEVAPKRVGLTGFCMGGLLTWKAAEQAPEGLGAIAPFYGGGYQPTAQDIRKIQVPVLAVWGEHDDYIPAQQRDHIIQLLQQEGTTHQVLVCQGAGHKFMNDAYPASYHADCARQGWEALTNWFNKYL